MIGFIIGMIVFIFVVMLVAVKSNSTRTRTVRRVRGRVKNENMPDLLGINNSGVPIVQALNSSLSPSYLGNVKNRVLMEHPNWLDHEYEWTFFELKRYFVMNSILKSVPMFSSQVDEIWHQMLMFTREYEKFTKDFYKETLHHTPTLESTPIPGERAFFDWIYLSLFEPTSNSRILWGGFLRNPIKREILNDFRILTESELLNKYFRQHDDWMDVKRGLIQKMKNEINGADAMNHSHNHNESHSSTQNTQLVNYALGAAVFYSLYQSDHYEDHMNEIVPEEYEDENGGGAGIYCSGYTCSTSDDHSGGDSGGDSGGASCSSFGGGCSS
ncbi:glycine-rich domain-containing protein [Litchfieldia alkalitelluris]|uniref:hypothetical protein n=1 Tax=Litchfieldia alkalitelluris TaxID=304268 RepID=UPI001F21375C|nr:hypothetical protein [Litchfieldia alkalitelluris]